MATTATSSPGREAVRPPGPARRAELPPRIEHILHAARTRSEGERRGSPDAHAAPCRHARMRLRRRGPRHFRIWADQTAWSRPIPCQTGAGATSSSTTFGAFRCRCSSDRRTDRRAAMPSPAALPICFVAPARTSPATNTPSSDSRVRSVRRNEPRSSRSTLPRRNRVFGSRPTKTNAAAGSKRRSRPETRSRVITAPRRPSARSKSRMSIPVWTSIFGFERTASLTSSLARSSPRVRMVTLGASVRGRSLTSYGSHNAAGDPAALWIWGGGGWAILPRRRVWQWQAVQRAASAGSSRNRMAWNRITSAIVARPRVMATR